MGIHRHRSTLVKGTVQLFSAHWKAVNMLAFPPSPVLLLSSPSLCLCPQDSQCGFGVVLDEVQLSTGETVIAVVSITPGGPAERVSAETLLCSCADVLQHFQQ